MIVVQYLVNFDDLFIEYGYLIEYYCENIDGFFVISDSDLIDGDKLVIFFNFFGKVV